MIVKIKQLKQNLFSINQSFNFSRLINQITSGSLQTKKLIKSENKSESVFSNKIYSIQNKKLNSNITNIDDLKKSENPKAIKNFKQLAEKYDNFIFDLDGVLWRGNEILKNSIEAIKTLRKTQNKKVFFLTNSNKSTRKHIQNKMNQNGLDLENTKLIYSSSYILSNYIRETFPQLKKVYVIGREGLITELKSFDFEVFGGYEDDFKKTSLNETAKIEVNSEIEACVCGFDDEINYFKIFYAMQIINKTNKFFGTNYDKYVNIAGRKAPGTYSLIASLETCTEKKATVVSKPDPRSLEIIFRENNIEVSEAQKGKTLMIGDNMNTDIKFANNAGVHSLLVFSGVTSEQKFFGINYDDKQFIEKFGISKPTYYSKEIKY